MQRCKVVANAKSALALLQLAMQLQLALQRLRCFSYKDYRDCCKDFKGISKFDGV